MAENRLLLLAHSFGELRGRHADLYERAPVGYLTVGRDGRILEVNHAGAPMLGSDRKPLEGETFAAFVDPGHRDQWNATLAHALEQDERQACAVRLHRKDGAHFQGWRQLQPVESDRGPAVRVGLADITEFSRKEEELRASEAQLEVASRLAAL